MSSVVGRGLVCVALLARSVVAHAEANAPSAPTAPAAPTQPAANPAVIRVYMRAGDRPLTFSARAKASHATPTWCIAPCDAQFAPGDYQLKLNGVSAGNPVALRARGTLEGRYHSREASRAGGWLALNVGGILGGVFITVGALGGPSWAFAAGGGSIAAGAVVFLITYRADSASVTFTPAEPSDVRGMPIPESRAAGSAASAFPDRTRLGSQARGLGFRIAF